MTHTKIKTIVSLWTVGIFALAVNYVATRSDLITITNLDKSIDSVSFNTPIIESSASLSGCFEHMTVSKNNEENKALIMKNIEMCQKARDESIASRLACEKSTSTCSDALQELKQSNFQLKKSLSLIKKKGNLALTELRKLYKKVNTNFLSLCIAQVILLIAFSFRISLMKTEKEKLGVVLEMIPAIVIPLLDLI